MKVVLIPLAGRGKRFVDEGYTTPKPLIPIDGVPMVIAAAKSLPAGDIYVFICLEEHIKRYHIDNVIYKYFPKSRIVAVKNITRGQASTCLLAEELINEDDELIIGACDNDMQFDKGKFEQLSNKTKTDALIFTFRNNPNVLRNPEHWGWVDVAKGGLVKKVLVKKPLSHSPTKDHAIVGCFVFKKAKYFFENAKEMIAENKQINGEFYIDECMNVLIENKLRVKNFEIKKYIGWGTPADFKTHEYWSSFFKQNNDKK